MCTIWIRLSTAFKSDANRLKSIKAAEKKGTVECLIRFRFIS